MFKFLEHLPYVQNPRLNTHSDIFQQSSRSKFWSRVFIYHPHLPRGKAFHFTPFMRCNGMGNAFINEDVIYIFVYRSRVCSGESPHLLSVESAHICPGESAHLHWLA